MSDIDDFFAWSQFASSVATVVIAGIAVYYSAKAALAGSATVRATKDSVFIESTVRSLMDIVAKARSVRAAYRGMFDKFGAVADKTAARMRWITQREEVSTILGELVELLPEILPAQTAWQELEREEDTFATSDVLVLPATKAINTAQQKYEDGHRKFIKCAGEIMHKLR